MCIIINKPAGVPMPAKSRLEYCWTHNPDGGGFMYADGGRVHIQKGFMTFKSFYKALKKHGDMTATPVVMHFRIATHGGINRGMTHPFEITTDSRRLTLERADCFKAVAHNGIISLTASLKSDMSDSAIFARDYLTRIVKGQKWYTDKQLPRIVHALAGVSRLAIMTGDGHVERVGKWYSDDGVYYSNDGYKERPPKYTAKSRNVYIPCDTCETWDCEYCKHYDDILAYYGDKICYTS